MTMTPDRYRKCLDILGLSQRGLAPVLRCSDRLTRDWAMGRASVPPRVAEWLETCVTVRLANPDPPVPDGWRRSRFGHAGQVKS
jgi:hypothetical protein